MAKKKKSREVGLPVTRDEYTEMVFKMHSKLICLRDVMMDHIKIDFYFPEKEMAINFDEIERDDRMWLLYEKDTWVRTLTPFEVCGEDDIEFEWQKK